MAAPESVVSANKEAEVNRTRTVLFFLLAIFASVFLFVPLDLPNRPTNASVDLFKTLMNIPNGSTVIIQSDWTNSTRGESGGEMDALLRILMRKDVKFALYSAADPQAPQVARDVVLSLNEERQKKGERVYKRWEDFIVVGYFPSAEGVNNGMAANLRKAWDGRKDVDTNGNLTDIFESPVLKNVNEVTDASQLIIVTASNTFNVLVERLSAKMKPAAFVTGVMGPESTVYYASKQLAGLCAGLKGALDLETMMEYGVNVPGKDGKAKVQSDLVKGPLPGFPGETNFGKGKLYFPTLHVVLFLLIVAVVAGNVSMFRARKRSNP